MIRVARAKVNYPQDILKQIKADIKGVSPEEIEFMTQHLPIQIAGDPSEKIEVSNYKDLERIETNRINYYPIYTRLKILS